MKTISFTALLYGKEYLRYALRSVVNHVSECWVLYTPTPSFGYSTSEPCPDSRDELFREAVKGAGSKLRWVDVGPFPNEGAHRNAIYQYAPDADAIVVVDADEIWQDGLIERAISTSHLYPMVKMWRVPIIHYWRSFSRCVLHDPAYPVRLILKGGSGELTLAPGGVDAYGYDNGPLKFINHFGYAQRPEIVRWKWLVHGHLAELRKDCDWLKDKYLANAQTDCHPVGSEFWNPEQVNPADYLPAFMADHPYMGLEIIE